LLSGFISNVTLLSIQGKIAFIISPIIFVGTGVAYIFKKLIDSRLSNINISELLEEVPDPDKTTNKEI